MQNYKQAFIEFSIQQGVLKFGDFTLKSGRQSPYFFNAGLFDTGQSIGKLSRFYAQAIMQADIKFDMLFGPAYKGIPLAAATAIALAEQHGKNLPYAFNRKESKSHGEGGNTIGATLEGRILIIDDVITAGTATNHAIELIKSAGAEPAGVVISLNRQEKGSNTLSAIQEIESHHNIPVISIATLADLLEFMKTKDDLEKHTAEIERYQSKYGI